jgi:undecaprenyl-diphosphatase
VAAGR